MRSRDGLSPVGRVMHGRIAHVGKPTHRPATALLRTRIVEAVERSRVEAAAFTADLVRIPTENPPGGAFREGVDHLVKKLEELGAVVEVIETSGPGEETADGASTGRSGSTNLRHAVIASFGGGRRSLCFHGHLDVVPAFRRDQFEPVVRRGSLFGRGASDMKGGLAAMIFAVQALRDAAIDLDGRLEIVIVPDEETGGALGSARLATTGRLGKDSLGMLTAEPTSGVVWNACRGAISLEVTVKGKPVHVGLSHAGVNAFERALPLMRSLFDLESDVRRRVTSFRIHPAEARRSILLVGGRCEGGTGFNVVPGSFSFTVDRRFNPEESLAEEKERLLGLIDRFRGSGVDLEVRVLQEAGSAAAPEDHGLARALGESVEAITGRLPSFEMCPGLLETRFYSALGVPAYAYGPGILSVSHGPREFVKLEDIAACTAVYALTAARVLSPSGNEGA